MTNSSTYFKYSVLLLIFIALIWFYFKACGHSKPVVATVKHDTTFVKAVDTIRVPYEKLVPYKVIYWKEKVLHDTFNHFPDVPQGVDSARILEQYMTTRYYGQDYPIQYGYATIYDTVTQNRIIGRSILLNQDIPQVKETVTIEKKRIVLYAGVQAIGNKDNLPYASGITLDLQLRSGGMIGGGAYLTNDRPMFGVAVKFPIRLRKQR